MREREPAVSSPTRRTVVVPAVGADLRTRLDVAHEEPVGGPIGGNAVEQGRLTLDRGAAQRLFRSPVDMALL